MGDTLRSANGYILALNSDHDNIANNANKIFRNFITQTVLDSDVRDGGVRIRVLRVESVGGLRVQFYQNDHHVDDAPVRSRSVSVGDDLRGQQGQQPSD